MYFNNVNCVVLHVCSVAVKRSMKILQYMETTLLVERNLAK